MKVLFLSANAGRAAPGSDRDAPSEAGLGPEALPWLNIDREYNAVQVALDFPGLRGRSVIEMIPDVQWDQLRILLSRSSSRVVLHFSGHGGADGSLYMKDDRGGTVAVNSGEVVRLVRQYKDRIALIVLNACYTDVLAGLLTEIVDVVVGMESRVQDNAAMLFSRVFYDELVTNGRSVGYAFESADGTVAGRYSRDRASAIIKLRMGVDPSELRLFQAAHDPERDRAIAEQIGTVLRALLEFHARNSEGASRLAALEASFAALLQGIDIAMPDRQARPQALRILEESLVEQCRNAKAFRSILAVNGSIASTDLVPR